jgi:hypothetical protein
MDIQACYRLLEIPETASDEELRNRTSGSPHVPSRQETSRVEWATRAHGLAQRRIHEPEREPFQKREDEENEAPQLKSALTRNSDARRAPTRAKSLRTICSYAISSAPRGGQGRAVPLFSVKPS